MLRNRQSRGRLAPGAEYQDEHHAWPGTTTRSSSRSRSRSHSRSRSATRTISSTSSSQVSSVRSSSSHSGTFHHPESISSASELSPILPFWTSKRHLTCGNPPPDNQLQSWRLRDKLKTVHAALILCLNIGVDPPDVFKTVPGAVLECWIDPTSLPPSKALEAISRNLQHQFEGINPRLRYKTYPEPSVDDVRKYLMTLRKSARDERVLLYYNGHGVPRPTASGEFWVFNKNHTQYIPVSIIDFQNWIGSPCILVWDCSGAGNILHGFTKFGQRRDEDVKALGNRMDTEYVPYMNSVQLASCKADETLPNAPELPADLFTSCLTSPIETALRYFVLSNQPPPDVTVDLAMQIPGDLKDRRTPLGELNWIFTAVTDTIAWTVFPRHIFRKLFRQDLMIASLFRNYLLAERIMRNYGCTPQSYPELPPTHNHPMWDSWDLAVYGCLAQLPRMLNTVEQVHLADDAAFDAQEGPYQRTEAAYEYVPSTFFAEHLSAFEVWLQGCPTITKHEQSSSRHSSHTNPRTAPPPPSPSSSPIDAPTASLNFIPKRPPDQLPILLQVLLAQAHRLRALILLSQFVDLGPWAVQLALEIGIFPYVQKLLQSPAAELKPVLIFIWARILAVDRSCQVDLLRDDGFMYFANVLSVKNSEGLAIPNAAEHRAMCAFILSVVARDYPSGQDACVHKEVLHDCLFRLDEDDFLLRQWSALCISQLWSGRDDIKALGLSIRAQEKLIQMLSDNSVEVRAAVMYALSTFLGASGSPAHEKKGGGGAGGMLPIEERDQLRLEVALATGAVLAGKEDASPMVRKELMVLMSCLVKEWRGWFVCAAWIYWEEHSRWNRRKNSTGSGGSGDIDEDLEDGIPDDRNGAEAAVAEWIERASVEDPRYRSDPGGVRAENRVVMTSFFTLLAILYELSIDPYPEVAEMARTVVDWILALLFESTFALLPNATFHLSPTLIQPSSMTPTGRAQARNSRISASHPSMSGLQASLVNNQAVNRPDSPAARRLPPKRTDNTASTAASAVSNTLKRTSSFAASLKNLAAGYAHSLGSPVDSPPSSPSLPHAQRAPASPTPNFNKPITAKLYSDVARYQSPWITPNLSANPPSPHASRSPLTPKLNGSSSNHRTSSRKNFTAVDIMSALIEEDSQRLKRRRRQPWKPIDLGLGETANVADVLPLKSGFYDWASEYYWEPLMRQAEVEEPGSVVYNEHMWRRQRNENVVKDAVGQIDLAADSPWDRPVASLNADRGVLKSVFHSFEPHLATSDEGDVVNIWDWSKRKQICSFSNGNFTGATITAVHFINEHDLDMILVGSADGYVKIYRNYNRPNLNQDQPLELVSSFKALSDMIPMKRGSGLVSEWQQSQGILLVGGDSQVIRAWDAHREICLSVQNGSDDINTHGHSSVTSLTSDPFSASLFVAGYSDGMIRAFDRRLPFGNAVIRMYNKHQAWVQNVSWPKNNSRGLLSASLDGEVRLWDIRQQASVSAWHPYPAGLASMAVHDQVPIFATSSAITPASWRNQTITVHSIPPTGSPTLSSITLPSGLHHPARNTPSSYIPGWTSLSFHPNEMIYAVGGADGVVKLLGYKPPHNIPDPMDLSFDLTHNPSEHRNSTYSVSSQQSSP